MAALFQLCRRVASSSFSRRTLCAPWTPVGTCVRSSTEELSKPSSSPCREACGAEPTLSEVVDSMVRNFMTSSTKEARLSRAREICVFSKKHSLYLRSLTETSGLYGEFLAELQTSSIADVVSVMECLHPRDPIVAVIIKMLAQRKNELDFKSCTYLCRLALVVPALMPSLKYVFSKLREHLVNLMGTDATLDANDVQKSINMMIAGRHFSMETADLVEAYLARHLHRFDLITVTLIIVDMAKGAKRINRRCHQPFLEAVNTYFLDTLHKSVSIEDRVEVWGKNYGYYLSRFFIFYSFTKFYEKTMCDKVTEIFFGPFDHEIHNPLFMTRLTDMCAKLRYYDDDLLDYIMQLSYNQVEAFHLNELAKMLPALQSLNHEHQAFLSKAVEIALGSHDNSRMCELYWSILNSSVFMNTYHLEVIERFLTDDMMEESLGKRKFFSPHFLKLLIGLTVENPHLQNHVTRRTPCLFGDIPYQFTSMSDQYVKYALHSILSMYKEKAYSKFGSNFNQALKTVAGSGHYRSEPLSLSGYNFDFEVLFGIDGKPLSVYPKYVTLPNALKSFGVGREGTIARDRAPPHSSRDSSKVSMLLEDLKSLEEVVDTDEMAPLELKSFGVGREDIRASPIPLLLEDLRSSDQVVNTEERTPLGSMDYVTKAACVRVASDWAERFASPSMMGTPRIARRVVFEVNGPVHYASNIRRHLRGNDVVKKRQLEALGWEVIHVPHYEWNSLKTGDDHIRYIMNKLST